MKCRSLSQIIEEYMNKNYVAILVVSFIAFLWASPAIARIGDSYSQCVQRYGEALYGGPKTKGNLTSSSHNMNGGKSVWIIYINNRAEYLKYRSSGDDMYPHISSLLKANSNGMNWRKSQFLDTMWTRDGYPAVTAKYMGSRLDIFTEDGLSAAQIWLQYQKDAASKMTLSP